MPVEKINLADKFTQFTEQWTPKLVGKINNQEMKIAKIAGEFVWHHHPDTDELFLVVAGTLRMKFRDGDVEVNAGEIIVVPAGVEHLPVADEECHILMIESEGTLNTGNVTDSDRTVADLEQL